MYPLAVLQMETVLLDGMTGFEFEEFFGHLLTKLSIGQVEKVLFTQDEGRDILVRSGQRDSSYNWPLHERSLGLRPENPSSGRNDRSCSSHRDGFSCKYQDGIRGPVTQHLDAVDSERGVNKGGSWRVPEDDPR